MPYLGALGGSKKPAEEAREQQVLTVPKMECTDGPFQSAGPQGLWPDRSSDIPFPTDSTPRVLPKERLSGLSGKLTAPVWGSNEPGSCGVLGGYMEMGPRVHGWRKRVLLLQADTLSLDYVNISLSPLRSMYKR